MTERNLSTMNTPRFSQGVTRASFLLGSALISFLCWSWPGPVDSQAATARLLPSGDAIEIVGGAPGSSFRETIPVHRSGRIQYFSAGVGIEERQAQYPRFPLKIILVAGPKAYLTRVEVTIVNETGSVRLDIPADHVNGPWLFVDLPAGTYAITAAHKGETVRKTDVPVAPGAVRTVYLRWAEGPTLY